MKNLMTILYIKIKEEQRGYALLEYTAGALVVATVLWTAMNGLGTSISGLLNSIGNFVAGQASDLVNN